MDQIEQAVMYALGPQVDPNLKAQVNYFFNFIFTRANVLVLFLFESYPSFFV